MVVGMVALLATICFFLGILGAIHPKITVRFWKIQTRKRLALFYFALFVSGVAGIAIFGSSPQGARVAAAHSEGRQEPDSLRVAPAKTVEAGPVQPRGPKRRQSDRIVRVNGSGIVLHAGPSKTSEALINTKATQALGSTMYLTIDNSVTALEECTEAGWSKIRVTEPEWLRATHIGWVPSDVLRGETRDRSGRVVFTDADFQWDASTTPYRAIIIAGVNRIYRDNVRCKTIDPTSVFVSTDEGTPSDPVFCVVCGSGLDAFNASFSKSQVEGGARLAAAGHLDRTRAVDLCEAYAKSKATHPSTVSFSRVMDLAVLEHPNGRTTIMSSFTAKNGYNLQLTYKIRCLCDAHGLIEANFVEAK